MPRRKTARDRAVDVLRAVLERGGRATPLLASAGRGLSAADQDLLRELVLGVLRWRAALDAEIAGTSRVPLEKLAPKLREILEVALYQIRRLERIPDYAAVSEAVSQARASGGEGAARLVNGVLRGILLLPPPAPPPLPAEEGRSEGLPPIPTGEGRGDGLPPLPAGEGRGEGLPPLPAGEGGGEGLLGSSAHLAEAEELARHFSHPRFLVERWLARFGPAGTRRILEADNAPSPVDLLANPRQAGRDALAEALRGERVETRSSPLSPLGLTVVRGNPMRTRLFEEGGFFVQDLGSQALPRLLPPGDTLVDLAAAPGGKSFASIFSGLARRSVAVDRSFDRLRLLAQNRKRLGVADIAAAAGDIGAPPLPATRFDRVLLDAPCSGTGTLRKSPEIRYRVTAAGIERLSAAQESWLEAAAALVAPGGYLLYATCSLEEEENERVVARVLERVPGLELAPIEPPEGLERFVSGPRFRLFPGADTDGFTAHLLRRAR